MSNKTIKITVESDTLAVIDNEQICINMDTLQEHLTDLLDLVEYISKIAEIQSKLIRARS